MHVVSTAVLCQGITDAAQHSLQLEANAYQLVAKVFMSIVPQPGLHRFAALL